MRGGMEKAKVRVMIFLEENKFKENILSRL